MRKTRRGSGRFILTSGWCYRITCIVFGCYRQGKTIFPTAGNRLRFTSCKRFRVLSGDPKFELTKANVASGRQRHFWEHIIRDEADYAHYVNYVHWNPVKHGLVKRIADWPFSSFYRYVEAGILPIDWVDDVEVENNDFRENNQ